VADDHDLGSAFTALRHDQATQDVVSHNAAGIGDVVDVSSIDAKDFEDVDAMVHAVDDRNSRQWLWLACRPVLTGILPVIADQLLSAIHF